jgi:hypothetical protein
MKVYFIDEKGLWHGASAEREECPDDAVTTPPDCEYPRWDGKGWVVDAEAKAEAEEQQRNALIQAKIREMAEAELVAEGKLVAEK